MSRGQGRGERISDHGRRAAFDDHSRRGILGGEPLCPVVAHRIIETVCELSYRGSAAAKPVRNIGVDRGEVRPLLALVAAPADAWSSCARRARPKKRADGGRELIPDRALIRQRPPSGGRHLVRPASAAGHDRPT